MWRWELKKIYCPLNTRITQKIYDQQNKKLNNTMKIIVNGKETDLDFGATISSFLDTLKLESDRCVIELNGKIIRREDFDQIRLADGDKIEVFSFVGGG